MLNFILYNSFFDKLLLALACLNISLNNSIDTDKIKKTDKPENNLERFKRKVSIIYFLLLIIAMTIIVYKYRILYALMVIGTTLKAIYDIYKNIIYNSTNLSLANKRMYTFATFLISILLSSGAVEAYIKSFGFMPHKYKEILLLAFLIVKIISYLFLLLINISIVISNIKILFKKQFDKIVLKMNTFLKKQFTIPLYNFYFYKKYKSRSSLIVDKIIYIVTFPLYCIIIMCSFIISSSIRFVIGGIIKILSALSNFDNNRDKIMKQILRIATIIALIIIYAIAIFKKSFFSSEVIELYNLIITVILIPIIYDEIKQKSQQKTML